MTHIVDSLKLFVLSPRMRAPLLWNTAQSLRWETSDRKYLKWIWLDNDENTLLDQNWLPKNFIISLRLLDIVGIFLSVSSTQEIKPCQIEINISGSIQECFHDGHKLLTIVFLNAMVWIQQPPPNLGMKENKYKF